MTERKQPICIGTDDKGELMWSSVRMEYWQEIQLYARKYYGDFRAFWAKRKFFDCTGFEPDEGGPSLDMSRRFHYGKRKKKARTGD